jgi:hypothetical protein
MREPYQGTVELQSGEIGDDLAYYLARSEQTPSAVGVGVFVESGRERRGGRRIPRSSCCPASATRRSSRSSARSRRCRTRPRSSVDGLTPEELLGAHLPGGFTELDRYPSGSAAPARASASRPRSSASAPRRSSASSRRRPSPGPRSSATSATRPTTSRSTRCGDPRGRHARSATAPTRRRARAIDQRRRPSSHDASIAQHLCRRAPRPPRPPGRSSSAKTSVPGVVATPMIQYVDSSARRRPPRSGSAQVLAEREVRAVRRAPCRPRPPPPAPRPARPGRRRAPPPGRHVVPGAAKADQMQRA